MTTFFFVRHAAHQWLDRVLVGRMNGVQLDSAGHAQAYRLGEHLRHQRITAVHSSPRERACETATVIARHAAVPFEIAAALDEIELGEWTGRCFAELSDDIGWKYWNTTRATARPPGGESMCELQLRIVEHLEAAQLTDPNGRLVLVTHAEPIRAAILHCLGMSLDDFSRIEIAPASISTIALDRDKATVIALNQSVGQ